MQTNTTLFGTLSAMVIIAFSIWSVTEAEKVNPCCVAVSNVMDNVTITGFRLQGENLPCIKAVIFLTDRGQFCIDPYQPWVKRKIIEFWRSKKNKKSSTTASQDLTVLPPQHSTISTQLKKEQTTNH